MRGGPAALGAGQFRLSRDCGHATPCLPSTCRLPTHQGTTQSPAARTHARPTTSGAEGQVRRGRALGPHRLGHGCRARLAPAQQGRRPGRGALAFNRQPPRLGAPRRRRKHAQHAAPRRDAPRLGRPGPPSAQRHPAGRGAAAPHRRRACHAQPREPGAAELPPPAEPAGAAALDRRGSSQRRPVAQPGRRDAGGPELLGADHVAAKVVHPRGARVGDERQRSAGERRLGLWAGGRPTWGRLEVRASAWPGRLGEGHRRQRARDGAVAGSQGLDREHVDDRAGLRSAAAHRDAGRQERRAQVRASCVWSEICLSIGPGLGAHIVRQTGRKQGCHVHRS